MTEPRDEARDVLAERWYHVGLPWSSTPGLVYAGSEDPHAGTFLVDCGDWPDELHFGVESDKAAALIADLADRIVREHNAALAVVPEPAPDVESRLIDILAWLNEGLSQALVVDGPDGIAKAAWVPIDRVLLARDRLALTIDDGDALHPADPSRREP